jgi:hypothetical protein
VRSDLFPVVEEIAAAWKRTGLRQDVAVGLITIDFCGNGLVVLVWFVWEEEGS